MRLAPFALLAAFPGPCGWNASAPPDSGDSGLTPSESNLSEDGSSRPIPDSWDRDDPVHVCTRWQTDRLADDEGSWTGAVDSCDAGDNVLGRENALRRINLMRWLARLPDDVGTDRDRDDAAQQCALMMHAQGALSHDPGGSWACSSPDGASAAAASVLASAPAVLGIDLFMVDDGNADTLGHRRWLLSNSLGRAGIGATSAYSCVWVVDDRGTGSNTWTAWPAPGPFPLQAMAPVDGFSTSLDDTGWTVQSDIHDLTDAQIDLWQDGDWMPLVEWNLQPWTGSRSAVAFRPDGWRSKAGSTYTVQIKGGDTVILYSVYLTDCAVY